MNSVNRNEDNFNGMSKSTRNNDSGFSTSSMESKSNGGPSLLFLWVWNWFAALPKTVTNLYEDLKSGELFARVPLLDAMCQFIVAVATSCHPQEEPMGPDDEVKESHSYSPSKSNNGVKVFQGTPRTLRSRTVEAN